MSRTGRHGEWNFGAACQVASAKHDVVVNKSSDDMHGWDHILDIRPRPNPELPADLQQHLVQCFAQIKTTYGKARRMTMKLSNAVKAAQSPNGCFVFLEQYTEGYDYPKIYGRHVWEAEITSWLRRARKTEATGKKELHKQTVSLSFGHQELIEGSPGDWIMGVMTDHGGDLYSTKKTRLVKSVGYSEIAEEGTVVFGPLNTPSDVFLHELGLVYDLPVSSLELYDVRFGMRSQNPVRQSGEGRIKFTKEPLNAQICIRACDGRQLEVPAEARFTSLVKPDDPNFKSRFTSGFLDIIFAPRNMQQSVSCNFTTTDRKPFLAQLGLLSFLSWSEIGPVRIEVSSVAGVLFGGKVEGFVPEPWMAPLEKSGQQILLILGQEKCKIIQVSLEEFYSACKSVNFAAAIFDSGAIRFQGQFSNKVEQFDRLMAYTYGEIGPWSFGAIYEAHHGARKQDGDLQTFYFDKPKLIRSYAFKQSLDKTRGYIDQQFNDMTADSVDKVATLHGGDLLALERGLEASEGIGLSVN